MVESIRDVTMLRNGVRMPRLGYGVFKVPEGETVIQSVVWALQAGYRSIDTARLYENEAGVGRAIQQGGVAREELFITTKVWNSDQGYDATLGALDASLKRLQMEYVDLYLVHWPLKGMYIETWRALEAIYQDGKARAIGVSNFLVHHLEEVQANAKIIPMVNQVEFHPYLQQPQLQLYCLENLIQLEAWAPLMKGKVFQVPELVELGKKHHKDAGQITLRWMLQKGVVAIPKTVHKERMQSNADIFDFELSNEEMQVINRLDRGERIGPDPDNFNF